MIERALVVVLMILMLLVVVVATIELGVILVQLMMEPPILLLTTGEMVEVFGFFLMVLLGLELLETIKAYLQENTVHVEVVLLVGIVAMARKVILLDPDAITMDKVGAIAGVILALAISYYLLKGAMYRFPHRHGIGPADADKPPVA